MQKEKIKPEQVMFMLCKKGMDVTLEQATLVLDLLRLLSKMVVSNYLAEQHNKHDNCKQDRNEV